MRLALALAVVLLALASNAQAHDGFVDIKRFAFSPPEITVTEGVLVVWRWDGPDLNHTVTGDAFESDPGKAPAAVGHARGDTFPILFDEAGTYAYRCRVHASMTGTVVVEPPPRTDERAPALSRVRARVRGDRVSVSFRVDEAASILADVRRPGGGKVLRDTFRFVEAGDRRTSVSLAGLPRGRLRLRLVAQDDAGNSSRPRRVPIRF